MEVERRWGGGGVAWSGSGVGGGTAQIKIIEKRDARSGVEWSGVVVVGCGWLWLVVAGCGWL
jgi:hypothetical protein